VQVQNLPRPSKTIGDRIDEITNAIRNASLPLDVDVADAITSTIRSSIRPRDGRHLVERLRLDRIAIAPPLLRLFVDAENLCTVEGCIRRLCCDFVRLWLWRGYEGAADRREALHIGLWVRDERWSAAGLCEGHGS